MINAGAGWRVASRSQRQTQQVIRIRSIGATALIAAAVASALAIAAPAYARSGPGGGGVAGAPSSTGPGRPSYNVNRPPNANLSGGHRLSASSSPEFSGSGRWENSHSGSTPPGWAGHGEKRGWDGGRMPPGLSHHDRDRDSPWRNRQLYKGVESGETERAQFHPGQFERRWGG
jgi:hypothetical protein